MNLKTNAVLVDSRAFVHPEAVLIGAGSFVPFGSEIPSGSLVVGSPAVVVKEITAAQLNQIKQGLSIYQDLTRRYLESFSITGVANGGRETLGVDH